MLKRAVKALLNACGYELIRRGSLSDWLPPWITEPEPVTDEVIGGEWQTHALQMVNRSYRPARLAYRRTKFGDDQRLKYLLYFLDLRDKRTLELGPFEGHHSILLEKLGVRENVAVEGRAVKLHYS
jgi:hypothetical protein